MSSSLTPLPVERPSLRLSSACPIPPDDWRDGEIAAPAVDTGLEDAFRTHGGALLRYVRRQAGPDEASDLVQEVFARAAGLAGFLAGALAETFAGAAFLAGTGFLAGAAFCGAGFFATGLAAAFDLLCLAVTFGMTILGWSVFPVRRSGPGERRNDHGPADSARRVSAGEPLSISDRAVCR